MAGSSPGKGKPRVVARILVTGAGGFIGTGLCPALAARGHSVVAGLRRDAPADGVEHLVLGDIGPTTDWSPALRGVEIVIHLAQRAHVGPDPIGFAAEPDAVAAIVRAMGLAGARRLVLVSSIKAMGEATARGRPFRPDDEPRPEDAYGRAKLAGERAALTAAQAAGIELVIVRPPLVYGPGVRANFAALIRLAASGWPLPFAAVDNRRSLIFRDNLVDLLAVAATHPAAAGMTLLARDDLDFSTPELIGALATGFGRTARLFPVPAALFAAFRPFPGIGLRLQRLTGSLQVDDHATRSVLGWAPPIPAAVALEATARAFAAGL
ncbi:MAG TPA: NAD-dependent epimerase/dehydratase family protein [Stellaceae bacterium]|jgi:nucleoside-diphosphate-sugar epimerase|nr:NAD-dependent epimerase/dehydratase family protein [Stellaceae bacterium]